MSIEEVRKHTEALLSELKEQETVDDGTRAKLEKLAEEIRQSLGDTTESETYEDQKNSLERVALEFQDQNPGLSEIMRRISQALSNIGI